MKPTLTMYIGVPCSGKTKFREEYGCESQFVLNADEIQIQVLSDIDWDYADRFALPTEGATTDPKFGDNIDGLWSNVIEVNERIDALFYQRIEQAKAHLKDGKDVIVDLTCHTKEYRETIISWFAGIDVWKAAVVFEFEGVKDKIFQANSIRNNQGKFIDNAIISRMMDEYEPIQPDEKFDAALYIEALSQFD